MQKTNITYFHRNISAGYSLKIVADSYIKNLRNDFSVNEVYLPYIRARIADFYQNLVFAYTKRNKKGINHVTGDVLYVGLVLPRKNTILTVHDFCFLDFVDYSWIKKFILFLFWVYFPVRRAKYVICISQKTKNDLLKHMPKVKDKVVVIYNPISDFFVYHKKDFNSKKPTILHIGTRSNKNIERVICSLKGVNATLRIIGNLNDSQISLLKENRIEYSFNTNLIDSEICLEYMNADIVSFPTLYEGFGLPLIEGQAVGRPVLSSNIEPIIEISNGSALLVNPYNISEIRDGFMRIIGDSSLRENLVSLGLENVKRFRSQVISSEIFSLYKTLTKSS